MHSTSVVVTFAIESDRDDDGPWLTDIPSLAGVMCFTGQPGPT